MSKTKLLMVSSCIAGALLLVAGVSQAAPKAQPAGSQALADGSRSHAAHGLTIARTNASRHNHANGKVEQRESAKVTLAGHGSRNLTGLIEDDPIAAGGLQRATITDTKAKSTVVFEYAPTTNAITFRAGDKSAVVVQNPDHSYSVDGTPAANGKAAVALLRTKPAYKAAGAHSLMLAYEYAQQPNAAYRTQGECGEPATPPAVCSMFGDFCECAACDKLGGDACSSCP